MDVEINDVRMCIGRRKVPYLYEWIANGGPPITHFGFQRGIGRFEGADGLLFGECLYSMHGLVMIWASIAE